ncbi:MAG TPA: CDP-diacylglycerol--serine O-phosphatidyltransferase [Terriglobia bacterium]|nr:CDP-diacylglycerol--serine O-phosphatidyltransferase [Terriglobia bacterium]
MTEKRQRRRIRDRARIQSGLSIVPSLFTVGNIFCGYYAVIATLRANYDYAAIAIGVGMVLDMMDGRIARMTQTDSDFGIQLDSLADLVTFGVAPAMLAFNWGLSSTAGMEANIAKHVNQLGWLATFAFLVCGALRLARFNIQTKKPQDTGSRRYFVGLPIPMGASMIAAVVHFFKSPILLVGSALLWSLLILLIAFLMISTVRYASFKEFDVKKPRRIVLFCTAMLIALVIFYSEVVLLVLATIYISSGLVAKLVPLASRFAHTVRKAQEPRVVGWHE